jgi:O-6-methylguanine DNA methyltransferase
MSGISFSTVDFEIDKIYVVANNRGVSNIFFGDKEFRAYMASSGVMDIKEGGAAEKFARELRQYLRGKRSGFKTALDISSGTHFQRAVWEKLLEIPYGEVVTYKELACAVGRPKAARAVGNAVGKNPLPIIIPCHRVLAANGLGGYSCGIDIKKNLLRLEGVIN